MYLIDPQNFEGYVLTTVCTEKMTVNHSGYLYNAGGPDLTIEEYKKRANHPAAVAVTWEDLNAKFIAPYLQKLQGPWKQINADQWNEALNVLPPGNWRDISPRFNAFYCIEAFQYDLHGYYLKDRKTGKFYAALRSRFATDSEILADIEKHLSKTPAAAFVLQQMDAAEDPDYSKAVQMALEKYPNTSSEDLENELTKFI